MDPSMHMSFQAAKAIAESIEGMMSPFSMAVIDALLARQASTGIRGDAVEMGVFRGKSAAIIASQMRADETLHLFDIADYFDRDALSRTGAHIKYTIGSTAELGKRDLHSIAGKVRFCHIDASHMYEPTLHELALADHIIADDGIVCLDDFTNLNYSQILAATYKYLYTSKTSLSMFLVTNEKAYLCRSSRIEQHHKFLLDGMLDAMKERDISAPCLAKTDNHKEYRAFHLRERERGETDEFYGTSIYGSFYTADPPSSVSRIKHVVKSILAR